MNISTTAQNTRQGISFGWRSLSLGAKLTIVFLAIALIPLALIAYINDRNSRQTQTNDANQALYGAAQQTAAILDAFMHNGTDTIRTEAQFAAVVDYILLPAEQRANSPEESRLLRFLGGASRQDPVFISSVAVLDGNGKTLADTDPTQIGSDRSDRVYFKEVLKTNRAYASTVEYDKTTKKPSIYFAAPIHDATGKIIGVLRKRYDAAVLMEYVVPENDLAGVGSFPVLVDENHVRLAHGTNISIIYKSVVPLDPAKVKLLQAERLLPPGTPAELATNRPDFETAIEEFDKNNQRYFAADLTGDNELEQAAIATMSTQNWHVVFAVPQTTFLAPINTQAQNNILLTLGIAVIVGFAGVFGSRTLSGPIVRLTQTAESIAAGDINLQAKVETGDEIGALAATFNRMTAQLREFIATLEERVAARTKDLSTVAEIGTATSTILDLDKLLHEVVETTKSSFNLYHAHIYLMDEAGENLVLTAGAGEPGRIMAAEKRSIPLSREQSLVARAAREHKGVTVNDVTQAPDFLPNPLLPETRSELAVPMMIGDKVLGVFDIQSNVVGRFTEADISIQTTLASQLAVSVQNASQVQQSIALAAELAGFRSAVDQAAIIAVTDVSGKIEEVNDRFVEISKYPRAELLGQDHRILNSGYHSKEFIRNLWVTIANGKVWRNEIRNKAKDGSLYWVDTTIAPILNDKGKPVKYVAIRFDITQRKALEEETARRAALLGRLDAITQKIQSTTTVEDALRIAAREVGQAVGMKPTIVSLKQDIKSEQKENS